MPTRVSIHSETWVGICRSCHLLHLTQPPKCANLLQHSQDVEVAPGLGDIVVHDVKRLRREPRPDNIIRIEREYTVKVTLVLPLHDTLGKHLDHFSG